MIIVNEQKTLGSKGFARTVFDSISPALIKHLSKEQMNDITSDVEFFSELDFSGLDRNEFNVVFMAVKQLTNLDKHWQGILLRAMQADPRYTT